MVFNLFFWSVKPDDAPSSVGNIKGVNGEILVVKSNFENDKFGTSSDCVAKKCEVLNEVYFLSLFGLLLFHKILC